jgi:hypothetical protein
MTDFASRGRLLWMELLASHPATALRFYPAVFGWGTQEHRAPGGGEPYTMWTAHGRPIGGLMPLPGDAKTPTSWLPYFGVPDVDAAVMRAEEEGAVVAVQPADIPGTGRYAVLEDPFGANFAVYRPEREPPAATVPPAIGEFSWIELATTSLRHAVEFYGELFGWTRGESHSVGELGDYQLVEHHGRPIGGIYVAPQGMPAAWLGYVRVAGLETAAAAVTAHGGRILVPPHDVPGGHRIVVAADPDGAAIALHQLADR